MTDVNAALAAALSGRYRIELELGQGVVRYDRLRKDPRVAAMLSKLSEMRP